MNDLYGWYDSADQASDEPVFDPPHDAPCPYCGNPLVPDDVLTHSFIAAQRATYCYFYRMHRTCAEAASETLKSSVFEAVLNRIAADSEPAR